MRSRCFRVSLIAALCAVGLLLTGCVGLETYRIATGPTPFIKYDIPVYATDNVPFEYTELGIVRAVPWVLGGWPTESVYMEAVVKEAKALGADAIIDFRVTPFTNQGGFMLIVWSGVIDAQGVAVKIKRP